ncbi:N-acetylmuramoyl-L-alanine amidase [Clostridium saudiense]|uniref:N-acetylmuramoyl-L-alanine amidase n=1 Tax=Clostridium saudiense TaxID=1414720 RepID=UPI0018AC5A4C|nr:N-acetylmuramoyl-L-alanine amidase [Clostridium saudiense]
MFKIKYVARVLCVLFIVNLFIADLKPSATSYSSNGAIGNVDIISDVDVSVESVEAWARSKNATETFVSLAKIYKQYGQARGGVNWVLAYVQAAKETGYGRFGGVLDESYHNPCGLKIPSGGDDYDPNAHKRFDNWEQGVIAHLDHLALYAGANGYPKTVYVESWKDEGLASNETYDPRHIGWFGTTSGILGKATNAIDLGAKWAPSSSYGVELFRLYCDAVKANYLEAKSNLESPANGTVITDGKLNITGWALHAFGIKEVRVLLDNTQIDTISVNGSRPDVNSTYPGYYNGSNSGFNKTIDISNLGDGNKNLEVIVVANDNSTQSYKRTIVVKSTLDSKSSLESLSDNAIVKSDTINISGWALASSGVKEVRVYVDGKDLGTVTYGTNRADINQLYPGYPSGDNAGFDGNINISSIASGSKTLVVKITANDGTTQNIERTIKIERLESKSHLDEPNNNVTVRSTTLSIRGWALASSGVKEVRVYVDGKDLGTITYGTKRTDVNNVYPGYSSGDNAGFEGNIDVSSISSGSKKLVVKITANDGTTQNIEKTINIEKGQSRSYLDEPNNNVTVRSTTVSVNGWALAASGVKEVRVYVDGKDLGTVTYGTKRTDVNNAYPGYSSGDNAGFSGNVDISSISSGSKKLVVKITANDGTTQSIERTIKIEKAESKSYLDDPKDNITVKSTTVSVNGWALAASGVKEVRVYVDGKDLGTVTYGTKRTDVNNAYPGYSSGDNAGFEGNIDISSISSGSKKLVVKITANDGTTQSIERTIKIEKAESKSYLDDPKNNMVSTASVVTVKGWAVAASGVKEVRVYVDGKDLGTVTYGTKRTDVNNAYPGYPSGDNAGFEGDIDISSIGSGSKKLVVKITANDGTTQSIERIINYRKKSLVVIDPGHENIGGDPGASATHNGITYIESNLNLQIAVRLKAQLEAKGIEVYMTRYEGSGLISTDSTESLRKRVSVANEMNADFFVSIHHNSFTSESANGFEVYYSTGTPITTTIAKSSITEDGRDLTLERSSYSSRSNTEKVQISKSVATQITNEVSSKLNMYNRGAKDSNLYVCKNTLMPSILVENGFLTNPTEAAKVSTASHQQKLAEIIAEKVAAVLQ